MVLKLYGDTIVMKTLRVISHELTGYFIEFVMSMKGVAELKVDHLTLKFTKCFAHSNSGQNCNINCRLERFCLVQLAQFASYDATLEIFKVSLSPQKKTNIGGIWKWCASSPLVVLTVIIPSINVGFCTIAVDCCK